MVANSYGQSRPYDRDPGVAAPLMAYGRQGGALYAAYRHPDNPLLLTHLRWQGPSGEVIEAQHGLDDVMELPQEEREAWAQVALRSTSTRPDAVGPNAPWAQAAMDPAQAFELGARAQRAREANQASRLPGGATPMTPASHFPSGAPMSGAPMSGAPYARPSAPIPPASNGGQGGQGAGQGGGQRFYTPAPSLRSDEYPPTRLIDAVPASMPSLPETPAQMTGGWSRENFAQSAQMRPPAAPQAAPQTGPEVVVVPCVEVEMPALLTDAPQDFTRDFARDVAMHFNQAARSIPQTRELRGWMRSGRIVLGARMTMGSGARAASRVEMEHAAGLLSEALARHTLPYAQLRFADAAEWNQGVPLPE